MKVGKDFVVVSVGVVLLIAMMTAGTSDAQQSAAATSALAPCGTVQNHIEVVCGTHSPEDLEATPDGKYLLVAQLEGANSSGDGQGIQLFDLAAKTFAKIPVTVEPRKNWGSAACPGPLSKEIIAHGISLNKRTNGVYEFYVVNHNQRQSMEMYELRRKGTSWMLAWHGCVLSPKHFNDVAALPNGDFISSNPAALLKDDKTDAESLASGRPIGYVVRWTPAKGLEELPGTRVGFPNGVLVSADGRFLYLNAWTERRVHKYDLKLLKDVGVAYVDFMPDNLSWVDPHVNPGMHRPLMLAAGVKRDSGDCPAQSGHPCVQQFGVAEIDPISMKVKVLHESAVDERLISSISEALQVNNDIYIGAYKGDRLLKIQRVK
jgi:hypothetical protein